MKLLIAVILLYACIGTYFGIDPLSSTFGVIFGSIFTIIITKERE